jgi:3-methyladenine DNA glycosylase AlkD
MKARTPTHRPTRNGKPSQNPLSPEEFAKAVVAALAPVADSALRPGMRAYMKNQFEFLGVKTPVRRAAVAELIRAQKNATASALLRCARMLWERPEREHQYVAVDLLMRHADTLTTADLPALFALVRKKSWWDTVDALASVIGRVVKTAVADDPATQCSMDEALSSDNLWIRRVAIIHQLGWRSQTDAKRLFSYAATCAHEKDFFIRKAIGWALRDYARHAPAEVRVFLYANRSKLSPLSLREAGKHIP